MKNEIDSSENDKQAGDLGVQHNSGSQDSVDSSDDFLAESESRRNNDDITESVFSYS